MSISEILVHFSETNGFGDSKLFQVGVITRNSIHHLLKNSQNTRISVDKNGNLLVGAAVGTRPEDKSRVKSLVEAGVNVVILDSSQGDSEYQIEMLKYIKDSHPGLQYLICSLYLKQVFFPFFEGFMCHLLSQDWMLSVEMW